MMLKERDATKETGTKGCHKKNTGMMINSRIKGNEQLWVVKGVFFK